MVLYFMFLVKDVISSYCLYIFSNNSISLVQARLGLDQKSWVQLRLRAGVDILERVAEERESAQVL